MTRYLETSARLLGRVRSACGLAVALVATAVALPSCSTRGVVVGGESNWLETCDTDAACGELGACRCGICTSNCSVTADCSGYESATCADGAAADAQCADSAAVTSVCLPTCSDARPCPGEQACVDGACTLTSASTGTNGGAGAGSSSSGGTSDGSGGTVSNGGSANGSGYNGADCTGPDGCTSNGGSGADCTGPDACTSNGGAVGMTTDNPSGSCTAPDDGGRISHAPDATDKYLPDCRLDLAREYYRVFRKEDGTAYVFPRPDGHPDLLVPCADSEHEIASITERYLLCESATSETAVNTINAMDPADALVLARYLHAQLVFYPAGGSVTPYPFSDDLLAACKEDAEFRAGPLAAQCEFELMYESSPRPETPPLEPNAGYDAAQALALSVKLNEMYGISGGALDESMGGACDRLQASAEAAMLLPTLETDRSCTTDEDCVLWQVNPCYDAGQCGESIPVADTTTLDAAFATIEGEQCGFFANLGCEAPGLAPCTFAQPVCRNDLCE